MSIEEALENCSICLKQIKHYEPEPFYVKHFFNEFLDNVDRVYDGIFEEGNRDFGLFVEGKISKAKFSEKARFKDDQNAIKFSEWYSGQYEKEHENPFPEIFKKIYQFKKNFGKLPEIKIMIRALERYKDDIYQEIKVGLSNDKIRSKEELEIEIKRQLPVFLEIVNQKRRENDEPKVNEKQVVASTFFRD